MGYKRDQIESVSSPLNLPNSVVNDMLWKKIQLCQIENLHQNEACFC